MKSNQTKQEKEQKQQKEQQEKSNSLDIDFEDLLDPKINLESYKMFILMYLFNAIFVIPIFILRMIFEFISQFRYCIVNCQLLTLIKFIFCYWLDILVACSVLIMYPLAIIHCHKNAPINFQYWAISCLIFLQSYILTQSYMQAQILYEDKKKLTFDFLFSFQNMHHLGLGRIIARVTDKTMHSKSLDTHVELNEVIEKSLNEENIDNTLFYFALDSDTGLVNMEQMEKLSKESLLELIQKAKVFFSQPIMIEEKGIDQNEITKRKQIIKLIRSQGFRGQRHIITNILLPHYKYVKKYHQYSILKIISIGAFVLLFKCAYPVWQIFEHQQEYPMLPQFAILGCFVGVYLNMISILIGLVINDDLKGKRFILNALETLILRKSIEDEDEEHIERRLFTYGGSEIPFNNTWKLDLSCNLSLESWDNARRLTILLNKNKQDMYENTFSFLALYLIYVYIILSQDFLGFDLFPRFHTFFKNPTQEYTMFVDFCLIMILFLLRVYQGSEYNEAVERLKEAIHKVAGIFRDKKSLFDFYFSGEIIFKIKNDTYKNITHKIYCTQAEKVLFAHNQKNFKEFNVDKFRFLVQEQSKLRVIQLCATMEKLQSQIRFDSEHFSHKFLGLWKSNITKTFSTFLVLVYIFYHSKIKHYLKKHKKKDL